MNALLFVALSAIPLIAEAQTSNERTPSDWYEFVLDDSTTLSRPELRTERRADSINLEHAWTDYRQARDLEARLARASKDTAYAQSLGITPPSVGTLYFYHNQTRLVWQRLAELDAAFRQRWVLR